MRVENKYFAWAAVAGFLLATIVTRGSIMAGFSAFALIAGIGWVAHTIRQHLRGTKHRE